LRVRWQTLLVVLLTAGLLWLFVSSIDLNRTWEAITHADLALIVAALLVVFLTYAIRAWRWRVLLQPIGPVRFSTAFRTTVIGFTVTFLLPARIGEVLRPYLLARREGLKASSTFATVIVERLLDVCTVFLLFALALPLAEAAVSAEVKQAGIVAAATALAALVVLALLAGHPERLRGWAERMSRRLPPRASTAFAHFVQTFTEGLRVMRSPGHLAVAVAWSVPLWVTIGLSIWLTSRAFDLTFSFIGTFLVVGFLVVGVAAPTPGGAGGFHGMYLLALTQFFGADPSVAGAAAIVLHAVSFVPVTLVGLTFMWRDGLSLGSLRTMRTDDALSSGASQP
jgi:uncharacterized protein (TIRG00374 family)